MKYKLFIVGIMSFLLTGCFNLSECPKGYRKEDDMCVMVESMKAIRKKEESCLTGYLIDGACYPNATKSNTEPFTTFDENGEDTLRCNNGYNLDNGTCVPIGKETTIMEYYECPKGYTFDESGVKPENEKERSGLKNTCYKRIEVEPAK